jgi:hypothetical protein
MEVNMGVDRCLRLPFRLTFEAFQQVIPSQTVNEPDSRSSAPPGSLATGTK